MEAHPAIEAQIGELTRLIAADPGNAGLHVRRGVCHMTHEEWDKALRDFDRAEDLDRSHALVHQARGVLWMRRGGFNQAASAFDACLDLDATNAVALAGRARSWHRLGDFDKAATDFSTAIRHSARPSPDLFVGWARVLAERKTSPKLDEAIGVLDKGLKRVGPALSLRLYAVDLEARRGGTDAALARLDAIMASAPRKESWLERRGDLCVAAGRIGEGREAYRHAIRLLDGRRPARRNTPAAKRLEQSLKSKLNGLAVGEGAK